MTRTEVAAILGRPYARVVVPDAGGGFSARMLEFPGCFAEGETLGEAYGNLEQAAESWILACREQGKAIPEPAESEAFSGRLLVRLPKSMHRRAAETARLDGVSLNQFIVAAVSERLGIDRAAAAAETRLMHALDRLEALRSAVAGR